jgi:hypothetical protein
MLKEKKTRITKIVLSTLNFENETIICIKILSGANLLTPNVGLVAFL